MFNDRLDRLDKLRRFEQEPKRHWPRFILGVLVIAFVVVYFFW